MQTVALRREDGKIVCERCLLAETALTRMRGLLGRRYLPPGEGILLKPASSVHTLGMRFAIDVAYCDKSLTVLDSVTMAPNRIGRLRPKAKCVIEAEAGAFERWRLCPGDELEIRA